jgi:hypothetical protein
LGRFVVGVVNIGSRLVRVSGRRERHVVRTGLVSDHASPTRPTRRSSSWNESSGGRW